MACQRASRGARRRQLRADPGQPVGRRFRDNARYPPKPGWKGAQVYARLAEWTGLPLALDTDVNGAALAEHRLGAGLGCETLVYYTIGTGIGGGVLVRGSPLHGALHPEIGHVRLRRAPGDTFAGACAFHGDCAEGLLSGPALAARFGRHPATVPPQDPAWAPAARDLAELLAMTVLTFSPQRIVVGGGVTGRQPRLLSAAIGRMPAILGGYLRDCTAATLQDLVVAPHLGGRCRADRCADPRRTRLGGLTAPRTKSQ
ncbi:ROK family protein [Novosphingobium colocasiae]